LQVIVDAGYTKFRFGLEWELDVVGPAICADSFMSSSFSIGNPFNVHAFRARLFIPASSGILTAVS